MRLVRIITRLNVGGPSFHAIHLARDLVGQGVDTLLVHGSPEAGEGSTAGRLGDYGIQGVEIPELQRSPHPLRDPAALARIHALLGRLRPDVVHTHLAKAGALGRIAARWARVPAIVHTLHGHVFRGYFSRPVSRAVVLAERILARGTDRILVPGEVLREEILRYRIAPPERILSLPLCVDWRQFFDGAPPAPPPNDRGEGGQGEPCIGVVGRLVPVKGHRILLRVLARLAGDGLRFRLLVFGDGPERTRLEGLARDLGLRDRVRFEGFVGGRCGLYRRMDLLVQSSDNEGVPAAVMEAMRCGVPVVATSVGGVPEVVRHGRTGLLVPPGDPIALERAVARLLRSPAERAGLGREGAAWARAHFDPDRLVAFHAELYRGLLAGRGGRGRRGGG